MSEEYTVVLNGADFHQVMDALEARQRLWERTAEFLRGREVDGEIEECGDYREAEGVARHYGELLERIEGQVGERG